MRQPHKLELDDEFMQTCRREEKQQQQYGSRLHVKCYA